MTYAIVEAGGTQLRVETGRFYDINSLAAEENETVALDRVLLVEHEGNVSVGQPLVEGATVEAVVMGHLRGRKIIVYKMRPKKKTRKKQGHRQELTRLMVTSIKLDGTVLASEDYDAGFLDDGDEVDASEIEASETETSEVQAPEAETLETAAEEPAEVGEAAEDPSGGPEALEEAAEAGN